MTTYLLTFTSATVSESFQFDNYTDACKMGAWVTAHSKEATTWTLSPIESTIKVAIDAANTRTRRTKKSTTALNGTAKRKPGRPRNKPVQTHTGPITN